MLPTPRSATAGVLPVEGLQVCTRRRCVGGTRGVWGVVGGGCPCHFKLPLVGGARTRAGDYATPGLMSWLASHGAPLLAVDDLSEAPEQCVSLVPPPPAGNDADSLTVPPRPPLLPGRSAAGVRRLCRHCHGGSGTGRLLLRATRATSHPPQLVCRSARGRGRPPRVRRCPAVERPLTRGALLSVPAPTPRRRPCRDTCQGGQAVAVWARAGALWSPRSRPSASPPRRTTPSQPPSWMRRGRHRARPL